jgi:N-glycosylase/DNA lyase
LEIVEYNEGIIIKNIKDFELRHIFDCGQCFRWNADADESYTGIASGKAVRIYKRADDIYIKGGNLDDNEFWYNYLDLKRDYNEIKNKLSEDEILREAISHGEGIRILNQDPYETIISFIISANNRIPMIKRSVECISKKFGEKIIFEGCEYYSFPEPEVIAAASVEDLEKCYCGFRAPYILETSKAIASLEVCIKDIFNMPTDTAHKELMKLKGIGPKVADCILLFSFGKYDTFPVDVWVKRVMQYFYLAPDVSLKKIRDFGRDKFGEYAGFAQEYLFFYARDLKGKEGLEK